MAKNIYICFLYIILLNLAMNYNDLEATKIKPQAYKNESRGRSVNVEAEDIMKDAEALLAKPIATKDMNKEYDTLVAAVIDDVT